MDERASSRGRSEEVPDHDSRSLGHADLLMKRLHSGLHLHADPEGGVFRLRFDLQIGNRCYAGQRLASKPQ